MAPPYPPPLTSTNFTSKYSFYFGREWWFLICFMILERRLWSGEERKSERKNLKFGEGSRRRGGGEWLLWGF
jgi:hypothetical protein